MGVPQSPPRKRKSESSGVARRTSVWEKDIELILGSCGRDWTERMLWEGEQSPSWPSIEILPSRQVLKRDWGGGGGLELFVPPPSVAALTQSLISAFHMNLGCLLGISRTGG